MERYLFDKKWFSENQKLLLWFLNKPIIKYWFRWILRIHNDCSFKEKIVEIQPNNYKIYLGLFLTKNGLKHLFKTDFRTHNKFSKRLLYAFYPLWWLAHQWDMLVANKVNPAWNLGFDTLTAYPDPDPESATIDGYAYRSGVDETLSTIRAGAGNNNNSTSVNAVAFFLQASTTSGQYADLRRGFFLFDTSSLDDGATISASVFSLYVVEKFDELSGGASANSKINVVDSTPASNTALANSDYGNVGSTQFGQSQAQSSISLSAYEDISITDLSKISKTGITKFATRCGWDLDNTTTGLTWSSTGRQSVNARSADQTGTTNDPKLVVTFTTTIDYSLALANGSFTLTGQTLNLLKALNVAMAQASFTLTGIATALSRGYTIIATLGTFTLTGVSITITKTLNIALSAGTFTLTGIAISLKIGYYFALSVGTFTLTGIQLLFHGWIKRVKPSIGTFTPRTKPSIGTWTNRTKPDIDTWTKRTKPL